MSPSTAREINGTRPAPLKIHKDSHHINKPSSSSSSSSSTTTTASAAAAQPRQHHPVIIYTHSPKIIHTQARDFMALVQKLTGLSHSPDDGSSEVTAAARPLSTKAGNKDDDAALAAAASAHDDSASSADSCTIRSGGHFGSSPLSSAIVSPLGAFDPPPPNPFLSEIPLFTPNTSDFFCSPRSFYRYPESAVFSPALPNVGGSTLSPSIREAMKALHDY